MHLSYGKSSELAEGRISSWLYNLTLLVYFADCTLLKLLPAKQFVYTASGYLTGCFPRFQGEVKVREVAGRVWKGDFLLWGRKGGVVSKKRATWRLPQGAGRGGHLAGAAP
jgi:hypothetical protein